MANLFSKAREYRVIAPEQEKGDMDTTTLLPDSDHLEHSKWRTSSGTTTNYQRLLFFLSGLTIGVGMILLISRVYPQFMPVRNTDSSRVDRWSVNRKDTYFINDSTYVNDEMWTDKERTREALHQWVLLSSIDRGVVKILPEERDGLPPPVNFGRDLHGHQDVYFTSAFHQLHCLSSIMQSYAGLVQGADPHKSRHGNDLGHITHCFDYIRQSIICHGDTTLEGRAIHEGKELPIGWGSYHDCRDWTQIKEWADARQPWNGPYYPDFL